MDGRTSSDENYVGFSTARRCLSPQSERRHHKSVSQPSRVRIVFVERLLRVRMTLTVDVMHSDEWTDRAVAGWTNELGKLERILTAARSEERRVGKECE